MRRPAEATKWALLAALVGATGCQASVTGQANVRASGSATEGASAQASGSGSARIEGAIKIRAIGGKLDYGGGTIEFAYDSARLTGDGTFETLGKLRDFLKKNPAVHVRIEGHTDSRGTEGYNKELSGRRAASIRRWLADEGIDDARLSSVGLGEEGAATHETKECLNLLPKDTAPCEAGWAVSRRAVFAIVKGGETIAPESDQPEVRASTPGAPAAQPRGHQRVWLLGAHVGIAKPFGDVHANLPISRFVSTAVPVGVEIGVWWNDSLALIVMAEGAAVQTSAGYCKGREAACGMSARRSRLAFSVEKHSSTGPEASLWYGTAFGVEQLAIEVRGGIDPEGTTANRGALYAAGHLGVDFFATEHWRVGPFVELAGGQFAAGKPAATEPALGNSGALHGWASLNLRVAYDFFKAP